MVSGMSHPLLQGESLYLWFKFKHEMIEFTSGFPLVGKKLVLLNGASNIGGITFQSDVQYVYNEEVSFDDLISKIEGRLWDWPM